MKKSLIIKLLPIVGIIVAFALGRMSSDNPIPETTLAATTLTPISEAKPIRKQQEDSPVKDLPSRDVGTNVEPPK